MSVLVLKKEDFFNEIGNQSPKALELFCSWIDDYKKSINWEGLFNQDNSVGGNPVDKPTAPKFHEVPFHMQKGVVEHFFMLNDVLIIVEPHPTQKGTTWTVIDLVEQTALHPFMDNTHIDITNYANPDLCTIDALKHAFVVLEDKLNQNKDEQEQ